MENLNDVFVVVKRKNFLIDYADINPDAGINHRFTGKGTNPNDKRTGLTAEDISKIKAGLNKMVVDIQKVSDAL